MVRGHAFIGVSINWQRLFTEEKYPICNHHHQVQTDHPHIWCSICGKELWRSEYVPHEAFVSTELNYIKDIGEERWRVIKTGQFTKADAVRGVSPGKVAWYIAHNRFHAMTGLGRSNLDDLVGLRSEICKSSKDYPEGLMYEMRKALGSVGLWDNSMFSFGLYVVLEEGGNISDPRD